MAGAPGKTPSTGVVKAASDPSYNLVSVLYHTLKGSDLYNEYIADAETAGDIELRDFFVSIREEDRARAQKARQLLVSRIQLEVAADWQTQGQKPSAEASAEAGPAAE